MDHYRQMGIKSLLESWPEVGRILERYDIGCVSCTVGTCRLEDVVQFHPLALGDRDEMMSQIEQTIRAEGTRR